MVEFTPEQNEAIQIAHELADMGCAIFVAHRNSSFPAGDDRGWMRPNGWQHTKPSTHGYINQWRPGMGLAMVTGIVFDVLDIDPRNGGVAGAMELEDALSCWPETYGIQATPSDGTHHLIRATGLAKGKLPKGVDFQAGDRHGEGRGYIWLAPTERISKWGEREGQLLPYRWASKPRVLEDETYDPGRDALIQYIEQGRAPRSVVINTWANNAPAGTTSAEDDPFDGAMEAWTPESAERVILGQLQVVQAARAGTVNSTLGGAARVLGRFVAGGFLAEGRAVEMLEAALTEGGVHSDGWNAANGLKWTARSVIAAGMANGAKEPWVVGASTPEPRASGVPAAGDNPAPVSETTSAAPTLLVGSSAVMAYWLEQQLGQGRLAGFFRRAGEVVHTPRVGEDGYVEARPGDDNGAVQIRPINEAQLAAKIQFSYRCEKIEKVKDQEPRRVPAMFPKAAAAAAVNAPEAMRGLRALRGITSTPMMRADGSVLMEPGYDAASGYLYLPAPGLVVPSVPDAPDAGEVNLAATRLADMVQDFPFGTDEDRANYFGLLLTPLLRELAPPSYKLFGIGAHQPGSGKSLLADIVHRVHGSVWRSEVPQDEPEWGKVLPGILASTSAPAVVFDNVSGVLRSSALAGMLTTSGEQSSRELGKSSNLTYRNDRVWVVTGNNLSLGGDLVRRTILVMIDPDMANPETRTSFAIPDLTAWVDEHRGEILWSLLVLARAWVVAGRPVPERKQSDSFARWEAVVAGILKHAGIPGEFDQESGKRAAAGGDDDGLALVLDHLVERFGDRSWSVAEALAPVIEPGTGFPSEQRDWLPSAVLDKLTRSEAAGRISMGWWLRNRLGRWVTGLDGHALVIREAGMERKVARWKVERR